MQVTAAAFIKAFLNLEGELTPILVSLVRKGKFASEMLDAGQPLVANFMHFIDIRPPLQANFIAKN